MSVVQVNLIIYEHLKNHCFLHKTLFVTENVYMPFTLIILTKTLSWSYLPSSEFLNGYFSL